MYQPQMADIIEIEQLLARYAVGMTKGDSVQYRHDWRQVL